MPIIPFLNDEAFDPDHIQAMSAAQGQISTALGVGDQQSLEVLAIRIIELARRDDRDAERLKERVLQAHSDDSSNVIPLVPWYSRIRG